MTTGGNVVSTVILGGAMVMQSVWIALLQDAGMIELIANTSPAIGLGVFAIWVLVNEKKQHTQKILEIQEERIKDQMAHREALTALADERMNDRIEFQSRMRDIHAERIRDREDAHSRFSDLQERTYEILNRVNEQSTALVESLTMATDALRTLKHEVAIRNGAMK